MFCYSWPSKYFIDIQSQIAFSDTAVGKELQLRTRVGDTLLANIVIVYNILMAGTQAPILLHILFRINMVLWNYSPSDNSSVSSST